MKVVTLEALTKLIQLVKSAFIKVEDVTTTTEIDTEVVSEIDTKLTSEIELATVATTGLYRDLTGIPTIGNATITFTQGGVTKGTITTNQDTDATIALDAGGGSGLTNTATGTDSLTILGSVASGSNSINIGVNSNVYAGTERTALGHSATCGNNYSVALGSGSNANLNSVAVGYEAACQNWSYMISMGSEAISNANGAIQIGKGTNTEAGSLYVGLTTNGTSWTNYKLLGSDGAIPVARLTSFTGADGTNAGISGAVPAPAATDNTKFLRGDGTWAIAGGGASYTAGTGIDITSNVISVTSPTITNTATGNGSLTIGGSPSSSFFTVNVGIGSSGSDNGTAVGYQAVCTTTSGVAIGANAQVYSIPPSIQLGNGTVSSDSDGVFQVWSFPMLDRSTGFIPVARLTPFTGADGTNAGTKGSVPSPTATDNTKYLKGDGTWSTIPATQVVLRRL